MSIFVMLPWELHAGMAKIHNFLSKIIGFVYFYIPLAFWLDFASISIIYLLTSKENG